MRYWMMLPVMLIFAGCSSKICGIDESVYNTFSEQKRLEICQAYAKAAAEAELLRQKRLLLQEQNRQKELELELKKVQCLYEPKPHDPYAKTQVLLVRIVSGEMIIGKRRYPIIPMEFTLARGEVRRVCLAEACFWMTYQGGEVLVNVEPDWEKERFERYVADEDGEYYITKQTRRILPGDWFRGGYSVVSFKKDGVLYRLRLFFRYR
jgi:hypothetical protein